MVPGEGKQALFWALMSVPPWGGQALVGGPGSAGGLAEEVERWGRWCLEEGGLGSRPGNLATLLEFWLWSPGMWPHEPCFWQMGWANRVPEMGQGDKVDECGERWTLPVVGSRSCNKSKYLEARIA